MEHANPQPVKTILSVSDLVHQLKDTVQSLYSGVWVRGEITSVKSFGSGHAYPTLKDDSAQLSCALFKGVMQNLKFKIEEGMSVIAFGRLDIYAPRGTCQFIIQGLEPDGVGALQLAFEQLKAKLQSEGLFDTQRKKPLPFLPQTVGVVTSWHGAALHDIVVTLKRRFPKINLVIYPVSVQGAKASVEIAHAIRYLSSTKLCDVMIVGRGGGSMEDLWAFNEEVVARAIADSQIPVVSAVGHETDFTIADFVADLRAPTPTSAAEQVVPDQYALRLKVHQLKERLHLAQKKQIQLLLARTHSFKHFFSKPQKLWQDHRLHLSHLEDRLYQALIVNLREKQHALHTLKIKLNLLAPQHVLQRGFVLAKTKSGAVVTHKAHLQAGDALELVFQDGSIWVSVN